MEEISPEIQGKVFAAKALVIQVVSALAALIAGPLADQVLEPAMQSRSILALSFAPIFGIEAGAGISMLYVLCAIAMLLIGLASHTLFSYRP